MDPINGLILCLIKLVFDNSSKLHCDLGQYRIIEEVVEIENDSFEEVRNTSFNGNDSAEAQEIIRNLTNQLSSQEDKYVEMKAEKQIRLFP